MKPLYSLLLLFSFACSQKDKIQNLKEDVASLYDASQKPFYHGVASGDPLQDRVIILDARYS